MRTKEQNERQDAELDVLHEAVGKGIRAVEHDRGLPAIYRQAIDAPTKPTPGPMLSVLTAVADDAGVTIDELAARDALGLWATVTRATASHHERGAPRFGTAAARAARSASHETAFLTAMGDLTTTTTRVEFLGHLRRLLRLMQSTGVKVDYLLLADDLRRAYWGTTTTEIDPDVPGRWVRDFHLRPDSGSDGHTSAGTES